MSAGKLTEAEREVVEQYHALGCHYKCSGKCATDECTCSTRKRWEAVERILAEREASLRAQVARLTLRGAASLADQESIQAERRGDVVAENAWYGFRDWLRDLSAHIARGGDGA